MASFFSKLRVVTLGAAHDLLDASIDLNSPSALRQYVRDLEDAISRLETETAVAQGGLRTLNREIGDLDSQINTAKASITNLLAKGTPDAQALARSKGSQILEWQKQIGDKKTQVISQKKTADQLVSTVGKLHEKHEIMLSKVRDLESLDRDSKAKEASARALQAAGKLVNTGTDISIDDIESKMRQRNDVAGAKFDQAIGDTSIPEDPEKSEALDNLLSSLAPGKTASA